ncbi:MAG TPA: zinc ribbon domain-containing protein, partial [Bacillota bacterium]|nr:zinc ribbon domain-containing protein [Bacillota bacterium]
DSRFARFHANQGLVLFLCEVGLVIVLSILQAILLAISWRLGFLVTILWLLMIPLAVVAIIGILNAINGKAKELPVIGKIKLIK